MIKPFANIFSKKSRPATPESPYHKVLISGPGRSGTTLIMQVLTELDFDTGFKKKGEYGAISDTSNAGMEQGLFVAAHRNAALTPNYIIKTPLICDHLASAYEQDRVIVDHLYIPIRRLDDVVSSRTRVTQIAGPGHPGGLDTNSSESQRTYSAESTYRLIQTVAHYDIPFTVLDFPRLAGDAKYFYSKLNFLMKHIKYDDFLSVYNQVVNPELIHSF